METIGKMVVIAGVGSGVLYVGLKALIWAMNGGGL
jgi:hypothetical protein